MAMVPGSDKVWALAGSHGIDGLNGADHDAVLTSSAGEFANEDIRRHNVIVWSRSAWILILVAVGLLALAIIVIGLRWSPSGWP